MHHAELKFIYEKCATCQASSRHGVTSVGVEYDASLAQTAAAKVTERGLQEMVDLKIVLGAFLLNVNVYVPQITIIHENVLNISIGPATAIFVYLVPEGINAMRPALLAAIERGVRVVTYGKCASDIAIKEVPLVMHMFCYQSFLYRG